MPKYIPVNNFQCRKCEVLVISLHTYDFRACKCGNFVDGGFDYCRRGGEFTDMEPLPLYWKKETK